MSIVFLSIRFGKNVTEELSKSKEGTEDFSWEKFIRIVATATQRLESKRLKSAKVLPSAEFQNSCVSLAMGRRFGIARPHIGNVLVVSWYHSHPIWSFL